MALDATVAGAAADSFLTVAVADLLAAGDLAGDPEVAHWLKAGTTVAMKEQALRQSTVQVNAHVMSGWAPFDAVAQAASGLIFPRSVDVLHGVPFIPRDIVLATWKHARFLLLRAPQLARARLRAAQELDSASEPNFSWSRSDSGLPELSSAALVHLSRFLRADGGRELRTVRLGNRVGAVR